MKDRDLLIGSSDKKLFYLRDIATIIRAYQTGLNVIFMNAIFRGSAHARPVR